MTGCRQSGFTLLEIVLVLALIAMIAGAGLGLSSLFVPVQKQDADVFAVVTALYRAQTLASAGRNGEPWGVRVMDDAVTLFSGPSYDGRDALFDETVPLEGGGVLEDGVADIIFAALTGMPSSTATVSLRFEQRTAVMTVNAFGVIQYAYAE